MRKYRNKLTSTNMKSKKPVQCIVKSSMVIRRALQERLNELGISLRDASKDAKARGKSIEVSSLSRYFKHGDENAYVKSGLSQENIIFLCLRYSIDVKLTIKVLPYNEVEASQNLEKIFGVSK